MPYIVNCRNKFHQSFLSPSAPASFLGSYILEKVGGVVEVVPHVEVCGQGKSTKHLLLAAEKIVKSSKVNYQNIWLVFDKDEFIDFDEVIFEAESKGYEVAWSNQAFEYWIYLHFEYSDAALHRKVWEQKVGEQFKTHKLANGIYSKNDKNIFAHLNELDSDSRFIKRAIKNSERRMSEYSSKMRPSEYDPGTMVYKLVAKLISYIR